jgi:hypothetical protein
MNKIYKILFLLLQLFFSTAIYSQNDTFTITGTVIDSTEDKFVPFVNLKLLSIKDSSFITSEMSDIEGKFTFKEIKKGVYLILATDFSYFPAYIKVSIKNNNNLDIYLNKENFELNEVLISADKNIYSIETDRRIYWIENDESIQNAFADNALENTPGVYIDFDGKIIVRGQQAQLWIDGKPSKKNDEDIQAFLKLLPASQIKRIELITNPSSKFTASNTNNIVNIVLKKKPNNNNLFAIGSILQTDDYFGIWSTVYISKKKFDFNIYALGIKASRYFNTFDHSYVLNEQDTSFYNEFNDKSLSSQTAGRFYGELTYHITSNSHINFSSYYYNFSYDASFNRETIRLYDNPYRIESIGFDNLKGYYLRNSLNFKHDFIKKGHNIEIELKSNKGLRNTDYYKEDYFSVNSSKFFQRSSPIKNMSSFYILSNYVYPFNEDSKLSAGTFFYISNIETYKNIIDTSSNLYHNWREDNILSNEYSSSFPSYELYLNFSGKIFSSLKYQIGLRFEKYLYSLNQRIPDVEINRIYNNFFPSLHLSYKTKSNHNFSLSYSRRANTPIGNLNPFIDRTNYEYLSSGNPDLKYSSTNSYELTYFKEFDKFNTTISVYQRNTKNDIYEISEFIYDDYFDRNIVLKTFANCVNNYFSGFELNISSNINNLKLNLYSNTYFKNLNGSYKDIDLSNKNIENNTRLSISYDILKKVYVTISPYYFSPNQNIFNITHSNFYTDASLKFDLFNKNVSIDIRFFPVFRTFSEAIY